ncbi:MAG TPA: hypothetical protein VFQ39_11130, partial [Longimicrobium sp.]|nr:hypothetical protein [Longimicrobium sp.]
VPARTAGLAAEWEGEGWTASLTASRAWDWVNYDRLSLAADFAADTGAARRSPPSGPRLREYWRRYDGSTELGATLSREVRAGVWLVATGQNLLGGQLGEPDNITIRAGRTLTLGARAEF